MSADAIETSGAAPLKSTMQAIVFENYGDADVLTLTERPVPHRDSDEILIEVWASSVNPIDYRLRRGELKGLLPGGFPRIPGYDVAGVVVQGPDDALLRPGDRVLAFLDHLRGGALAEYATCSLTAAAKLPDSMSMNEAAAIPLAGSTALQSLRDHGKLKRGEHVVIVGASGGVGAFAVQIARALGCHVDAVASGDNEEFCRSLGAEHFFNYEQTDFTTAHEQWDLVFDAAGKSDYFDVRKVLRKGGRYVSTEPDVKGMLVTLVTWPLSKTGKVMLARPNAEDLQELIRFHNRGQLTVTIDRVYSLQEAASAHRRVETGVDRGKVVIALK